MHYFYSTEMENGCLILREQELQHLSKSLRAQVGDEVWILDGSGRRYRCTLVEMAKKLGRAEIKDQYLVQPPVAKLHLAIAPTKNVTRMEWLVEKATEMGIHRISFVYTARTERPRLNLDRMQKIAISALKQSGNGYLPQLCAITTLKDFLHLGEVTHPRFIAHCQSSTLPYLIDVLLPGQEITILIGPEGDFTTEEISQCRIAGYKEISLGGMRLRTETAGIFVTSMIAIINKY